MSTAQTAVIYDGKRIIPAPRLSFSKNYRRSGDQTVIGTEHQVTLYGTLVGCRGWSFDSGSPEFYTGSSYPDDESGCDKFSNLVLMQAKLRELFAMDNEHKWFEIIGCDGLLKKWRARVISVDFSEDDPPAWTEISEFTITLALQPEKDTDDNLHIDHSESWDVAFNEEQGGIYTLSHTLSTQSEQFVEDGNEKRGWEIARQWIDSRLAGSDYAGEAPSSIRNDYIFSSTGFNLTDYTAYDYTVQRSIDEYGGTYSITETWTLSKHPIFRTWTTSFNQPRDDDATVTVEGEFYTFSKRDGQQEPSTADVDALIDAFSAWDSGGGPFAVANSAYSSFDGHGTLGECAVNRSVTTVTETRGDGTRTFGEEARKIQFSYEFSNSDPDAEVSITKTVSESNVDNCEINVTISGTIIGHVCSPAENRLEKARVAYGEIDCESEAEGVYTEWGGEGTLVRVSRSYTENERDGTIDFVCEFTDRFEDGVIKDETITIGWTCGDLKSDGESKSTVSVQGTIQGVCDSEEMPTAPLASSFDFSSYGFTSLILQSTSVSTNEHNRQVSYSYDWDDDDGPGLVTIQVDTAVGPENCDVTTTEVNISVTGNGCTSAAKLANANTAIDSVDPTDYVPEGSCKRSERKSVNHTDGTITHTYEYTTECDATVSVTITEVMDSNDCGTLSYTIDGEIKGLCFAEPSPMEAAEALYNDHKPAEYSEYGSLRSSRVSRNERDNSITFNYDFHDVEDGYEHIQTVSISTDEQSCCDDIQIGGTITPYCDPETGKAGQIAAGESAWAGIRGGLESEANSYCTGGKTLNLRSTRVSRNKKTGEISYDYTYRCCTTYVEGVLEESIDVTYDHQADVFAVVPILGRTQGPIIQDKNTKTEEKCSISVQLTFPSECGTLAGKPSGVDGKIQGIIDGVGCCGDANKSYKESDRESWNPTTGRYTRDVTFVCEHC